ncbi:MAG TPA: winged helix-turn-helix domain-containing protein [Pyrinomonadaceae bacterium]
MTDHGPDIVYKFGPFSLNTRERRLLCDGEPILLTPKAFDTLAALVERSGHVVTKDELMHLVWPDSFVEESGLTRNISVLRKELDRDLGGKNLIETVPKVGYRFNGNVSTVIPSARVGPIRDRQPGSNYATHRWILGILGALLILGGVVGYRWLTGQASSSDGVGAKSLAVLPFRPLDENSSDPNLELGLADALITRLSGLSQLSLKPTSAIRKFAAPGTDPIAAGKELGVETVLDGTIHRDGDRVLVSVQLIRVSDGVSMWAQRFIEHTNDLFRIQDSISERVVSAFQLKIDAEEQERLFRRYTENTQAFEKYLRGRSLLVQYTRESTLAAIKAFEEALKYDPNYSLARSGLATASSEMYLRFAEEDEAKRWAERADDEIAKALELDANLAETHQALAAVYRKKDFNWEKVLEESARALELNPNLEQPHYFRAAAFYHLGQLDEALRETELAESVDPKNRIDSLRARGLIALFGHRYHEAIVSLEEVQRLSSKPIADPHLAVAHFYNGDPQRAEQLAAGLVNASSPSTSARGEAILASILAAKGDNKGARLLIGELEGRESLDHHASYSLAGAYAQLGEIEKALYWLRRAAANGLTCYPLISGDRLLDPLKNDIRFNAFLNEIYSVGELTRRKHIRSE